MLIPLLLMGGIIGRLFREFAVTLAMTIFVSMVVSLTLTPMMASRFLRSHSETQHGRFYQWSENAFDAMLRSLRARPRPCHALAADDACMFFATLGLSVYLFVDHSEGILSATGCRPDQRDLGGRIRTFPLPK